MNIWVILDPVSDNPSPNRANKIAAGMISLAFPDVVEKNFIML
ncbi:MAG: hypothetical protein J07AB43_05790 [Candidatus Nanosalina sp. J07AB43]|nr:MAG: hypothetical protein J07AB43_05790 [Candidatus Nanosalina sp. J07AB43]